MEIIINYSQLLRICDRMLVVQGEAKNIIFLS